MVENGVDQVTQNMAEFMFGEEENNMTENLDIYGGEYGDQLSKILEAKDSIIHSSSCESSDKISMGYFSNMFCDDINDDSLKKLNSIFSSSVKKSGLDNLSNFASDLESQQDKIGTQNERGTTNKAYDFKKHGKRPIKSKNKESKFVRKSQTSLSKNEKTSQMKISQSTRKKKDKGTIEYSETVIQSNLDEEPTAQGGKIAIFNFE